MPPYVGMARKQMAATMEVQCILAYPNLTYPFIGTHKYGCEYHYMLVNLINKYEYY